MPLREDDEPGDGGPFHNENLNENLATPARLRHVRTIAEVIVVASGGSTEEADVIAEELVAYVDFSWKSLRLDVLAGDPRLWERHLIGEALRRWLAHLYGVRRRWAAPLGESVARGRVLSLAAAINFEPEDQDLFDNIYVHGFSVAETAVMFGLEHEELVRRLRLIWALVRRESRLAAARGADTPPSE